MGGYWLGHKPIGTSGLMTTQGAAQTNGSAPSGPVIYYRDSVGRPLYSLAPKQAPDGRPYRAVLASEDISFDLKAAILKGLSQQGATRPRALGTLRSHPAGLILDGPK